MIEDATLRLRCQDKVWDYFAARMRSVLGRRLQCATSLTISNSP